MNKKSASQLFRWVVAATAIVLPLAILLWLNQGVVSGFIDVVRDREAVTAYLDTLGAIGPLVLMGLIGLQVLIPSLPAEPPMMASAYAYGFIAGFLMSWVVSVAVSQAVFCLARYAGRPLVERWVPSKLLGKWTRTAGERGTMFFLLAFVIPPIPSDILIYVAGLSEIGGWNFFVANLFGRMPMIVLLTLVGAYGFSITPTVIVALTAIGIFMLMAWLYYVRQSAEAEASSVPSEADRGELTDCAPLQWRDAHCGTQRSSWRTRGTFRFGQRKRSDQAGPASSCLNCTTCDVATYSCSRVVTAMPLPRVADEFEDVLTFEVAVPGYGVGWLGSKRRPSTPTPRPAIPASRT